MPEALLLPGAYVGPDDTQAPVADGSFWQSESDTTGRIRAPIDERTGMPLPIAPRSDLSSIPEELISDHHHWFPHLDPVLRTRGGRALRVSRIQRTERSQHNHGNRTAFHPIFTQGPEIPEDEDTQAGLCVVALAHYLPDKVVDTSRGEPTVRAARTWELRRLSEPGQFLSPSPKQVRNYRNKWLPGMTLIGAKERLVAQRQKQTALTYRNLYYGLDPIRSFLASYVSEQDLSGVKSSLIRSFVERGSTEAGLSLLSIAALKASLTAKVNGRSLDGAYRELLTEGRLHPNMPPSAACLIKYKLGDYAGRVALLPAFRAQLLSQEEAVA